MPRLGCHIGHRQGKFLGDEWVGEQKRVAHMDAYINAWIHTDTDTSTRTHTHAEMRLLSLSRSQLVDIENGNLTKKDNYGRLNMIGPERANRALIGCDSQWNTTRWRALPSFIFKLLVATYIFCFIRGKVQSIFAHIVLISVQCRFVHAFYVTHRVVHTVQAQRETSPLMRIFPVQIFPLPLFFVLNTALGLGGTKAIRFAMDGRPWPYFI